MYPLLGGSSRRLPSRIEYVSPQGGLLPRVYGTTASPLWLELRGLATWQATRSWTVYQLGCHQLIPWLQVTSAMVPDGAWSGTDQRPWSTAPATGSLGRLGCTSTSDPWGVVYCALLRCPPRCVRVCGVPGPLALVHRCTRPVHSVSGVRGHWALVHLCVRYVPYARGVGGIVGVPPAFFRCCLFVASLFVSFTERKRGRGRANTTGTGMGSWSSGAAALCSSSCCASLVYPRRPSPRGCGSGVIMYTGAG